MTDALPFNMKIWTELPTKESNGRDGICVANPKCQKLGSLPLNLCFQLACSSQPFVHWPLIGETSSCHSRLAQNMNYILVVIVLSFLYFLGFTFAVVFLILSFDRIWFPQKKWLSEWIWWDIHDKKKNKQTKTTFVCWLLNPPSTWFICKS